MFELNIFYFLFYFDNFFSQKKNKKKKKFAKEVSLLYDLYHENVCRMFGACRDESKKKNFIILEKHPRSLDSLLGHEPLQLDLALTIAVGISQGIEFLHRNEPCVIHRGINPENILLDSRNSPKLINFGIAKVEKK